MSESDIKEIHRKIKKLEDIHKKIKRFGGLHPPIVEIYREYVHENYPRIANKFPLCKPFDIIQLVLNRGKATVLLFLNKETRGGVGTTGQTLDYNYDSKLDFEEYIKENEEEIVRELTDFLDISKLAGYVFIFPPYDEDKEDYFVRKGKELAKKHYQILKPDFELQEKIKELEEEELNKLLSEAERCLTQEMFGPAISALSVAMENAFIIKLKEKGKNIKEEEKEGQYYSLWDLTNLAYKKYDLISQKTFERMKILNKIRRFGTHHKSGKTIQEDTEFALNAVKQGMKELFLN